MEQWKDIIGYEGLYQVSNYGNVKSVKKNIRILRTATLPEPRGYKYVVLSKNSKQKHFYIHRLVAIHFIPNPENLPFVNHKSGVKTNNKISELEWCTASSNTNHAYKAGLINGKLRPMSIEKDGKKINFPTLARVAEFIECSKYSVHMAAKRKKLFRGFKITDI